MLLLPVAARPFVLQCCGSRPGYIDMFPSLVSSSRGFFIHVIHVTRRIHVSHVCYVEAPTHRDIILTNSVIYKRIEAQMYLYSGEKITSKHRVKKKVNIALLLMLAANLTAHT